METYDLVDALLAHQGQRHFKSSQQTSETCLIRGKPHYGIFPFEVRKQALDVQNVGGPALPVGCHHDGEHAHCG